MIGGEEGQNALTVLLAALFLFAVSAARAQPSNAAAPDTPSFSVPECAGAGLTGLSMTVGRLGPKRIKLTLGGGDTCLGPSSPSDLSASSLRFGDLETVRADSCPAFKTQANKLQPSRERELKGRASKGRLPVATQAGLFTITDWVGYFDLQSPKGRRAAERWVSQALAAARPCWVFPTDDRRPDAVDRLYAMTMGMTVRRRHFR